MAFMMSYVSVGEELDATEAELFSGIIIGEPMDEETGTGGDTTKGVIML